MNNAPFIEALNAHNFQVAETQEEREQMQARMVFEAKEYIGKMEALIAERQRVEHNTAMFREKRDKKKQRQIQINAIISSIQDIDMEGQIEVYNALLDSLVRKEDITIVPIKKPTPGDMVTNSIMYSIKKTAELRIKRKIEGHTPLRDAENVGVESLTKVAAYLLIDDVDLWPDSWPDKYMVELMTKTWEEKVEIALGLLCAVEDALNVKRYFQDNANSIGDRAALHGDEPNDPTLPNDDTLERDALHRVLNGTVDPSMIEQVLSEVEIRDTFSTSIMNASANNHGF